LLLFSFQQVVVSLFLLFLRSEMSSTSTPVKHLDLALLPVREKEKLCQILDQRDSWEELGILMQFSEFDVDVSDSYQDLEL
jgi:hypothetical protein